jgi:C_GCAxxG_C_C family probable redox protein
MKTTTERERQMASEKAAHYFGNGFHCAEAVAIAALNALDQNHVEAAAHATAFGGGFGRSFQEACGALSGALIVIGHLYGRREKGADWDLPAKLAAEIRQRFGDEFGTTHCATLRDRFGTEQQMTECRKLTQNVTSTLLALLSEDASQYEAMPCNR